MASALFSEVDLPKRLIPGSIALGAFTFTMTALPGTPAIQNAIPMPYFGTTPFAAPGLGLIGGAVMLVLGTLWLVRRAASAAAQGEGYGAHAQTLSPQEPMQHSLSPSLPQAAAGAPRRPAPAPQHPSTPAPQHPSTPWPAPWPRWSR
jgi:H+/gluconate symporter-like permease